MAPHARAITIIVPTLNEEKIIVSTLSQLHPWRARGHEIIVVDGHSTDDTTRLAEQFCDKFIKCRPGRARQMNEGAGAAGGNLLVFLHADTVLPETASVELEDFLSDSQRVWGRFDVRFDDASLAYRTIAKLMNWRSRVSGIATGDQALFVSRALYNDAGGFPNIELMEEIALSATQRRIQRPICLRSKVTTSARRWQSRGIVRTIFTMWCLRIAYFFGVSPARLRLIYDR